MSHQITLDYPEELPDAFQTTREDFEQEAKMAIAVKIYEMKRLSSGVAASLVGIDWVSFLLRLHYYGIPMIDLDEEKLTWDLSYA